MNFSIKLFRLYIKWSLVLQHVCAGGGGGNVTFGVYMVSRHIVVSVRHSGPLWCVRHQRCHDSLMNIERQALETTSGPRVLLGGSWECFLEENGAKDIV